MSGVSHTRRTAAPSRGETQAGELGKHFSPPGILSPYSRQRGFHSARRKPLLVENTSVLVLSQWNVRKNNTYQSVDYDLCWQEFKSTISCLLTVVTPSTFSGHCETSWRTVGSSALQSPLSWWWRRDAGWQISHFTIVWTQNSCPEQTSSTNMTWYFVLALLLCSVDNKQNAYFAFRSTRLRP